jgi:hypothetical protein
MEFTSMDADNVPRIRFKNVKDENNKMIKKNTTIIPTMYLTYV